MCGNKIQGTDKSFINTALLLDHSIFTHLLRSPSIPFQEISPTITRSPAKVQPSSSLSLSEPEDETKKPKVPLLPPSSFEVKT